MRHHGRTQPRNIIYTARHKNLLQERVLTSDAHTNTCLYNKVYLAAPPSPMKTKKRASGKNKRFLSKRWHVVWYTCYSSPRSTSPSAAARSLFYLLFQLNQNKGWLS